MDSELDSDDERRDRAIWYPTKSQQIAEAERELLAAAESAIPLLETAGFLKSPTRLREAIRRYRAAKGLA